MTPSMSLIVLCGLVVSWTAGQWPFRSRLRTENWSFVEIRHKAGSHLLVCLGIGGIVWLFNMLIWPNWSDQAAMLVLLLVEGLMAGLITGSWLYGFALLAKTHTQPAQPEQSASDDFDGVVHLRRFQHPAGVLPSGVMVVWNEWRGCWSSVEAALEDERNALAS